MQSAKVGLQIWTFETFELKIDSNRKNEANNYLATEREKTEKCTII